MPPIPMLATVKFVHTSGITADDVINTWHFEADDLVTDPAIIVALLIDFYDTVDTGGSGRALTEFYSDVLSRVVAPVVKVYNLTDPEPRFPVLESNLALLRAPISPGAVPSEAALCLSFKANSISGVDPRKLRGRVYLGPFGPAGLSESAGSSRPDGLLLTTIQHAGTRLKAASGAGNVYWITYSSGRAHSYTKTVGGVLTVVNVPASAPFWHHVTSAWVDNAWDTQRRRGERATAKSFS